MFSDIHSFRDLARQLSGQLVLAIAVFLAIATVAAALGMIPWPTLQLRLGDWQPPHAGMVLQLALLAIFVILSLYLPSIKRINALERSHRSFQIGMEDVARAYRIAHAADRSNVFALSGEFDSIRQRMELLRRHPDLDHLEPELLQLASVMSFQSRDLARVYSDEKVDRARRFLRQRQEEADLLTERLKLARSICDELRGWLTDIESEERQNTLHLKRLEVDLKEVLPLLGYDIDESRSDRNVVTLPKPAK